jgi:hypothetical protein
MKRLLALLCLSSLGGCVVAPPAPPNYGTRAPQAALDPHQWHVVSVEPVAPGSAHSSAVTSEPVDAAHVSAAPVYAPQTVIVQDPAYVQPYPAYPAYTYYPAYPAYSYYPPFTIGLGFVFGGWCCHHGGWGHGGYRGHGRH